MKTVLQSGSYRVTLLEEGELDLYAKVNVLCFADKCLVGDFDVEEPHIALKLAEENGPAYWVGMFDRQKYINFALWDG